MSNLTNRQILLRDFLLKRIGFVQDDFLDKYTESLEKVSPRFKYLGKQKKVFDDNDTNPRPEFNNIYIKYEDKGDYFLPESFNIIDFLNYEINLKKTKKIKHKSYNNTYITATDLSNYTYCPVSFSINRTMETEKIESAIIGTSQHEKNLLINYIKPFKDIEFNISGYVEVEKINNFDNFINENNQNFLSEISDSKILYSGHIDGEKEKKYFKNVKGNYYGQPDYIFKNKKTNKIFVVEEKFQFVQKDPTNFEYSYYNMDEQQKIINKRNDNKFYPNHINQLNSYIHGISEYEISYGYLIYWKYELSNGVPEIISCSVLKVENTEQGKENFINLFQIVSKTIRNKGGKFTLSNRNPLKCSSCVSNVLCGHKTGKYNEYSFPYNLNYLNLTYADFPEELKNKDVGIITVERN
jgi:hypothetical protein